MGKYTLTVVYITINHGFEIIHIDLLNKYISDFKKNCCKEVGKSPNPFPRSFSVRRINHKVYGQNTNYIRRPSVC